jgi:hypothetical protein
MKALFDTNIIIQLEDGEKLQQCNYSCVKRLCNELNIKMYYHPWQKLDLNNDSNVERRYDILARMEQYQRLDPPPYPTEEELLQLGWKESSDNDKIDNCLLFALSRYYVDILVTNDKGIIQKSKNITKLKEKVYTLDNFLWLLNTLNSHSYISPPPGVRIEKLCSFDKNNSFFDSLRNRYEDFDKWYEKCALDDRYV